jgi:hypothetical protein
MTKSKALKLKPGDKVRWDNTKPILTVMRVIPEPIAEFPRGRFPLIVTEEAGAITYLRTQKVEE